MSPAGHVDTWRATVERGPIRPPGSVEHAVRPSVITALERGHALSSRGGGGSPSERAGARAPPRLRDWDVTRVARVARIIDALGVDEHRVPACGRLDHRGITGRVNAPFRSPTDHACELATRGAIANELGLMASERRANSPNDGSICCTPLTAVSRSSDGRGHCRTTSRNRAVEACTHAPPRAPSPTTRSPQTDLHRAQFAATLPAPPGRYSLAWRSALVAPQGNPLTTTVT